MAGTVLRRIVLFLDGTWNTDDGSNPPTNVVRLHEALKLGVNALPTVEIENTPGSTASGFVVEGQVGPTEYVVHYDSGVGTGAFDRLSGGIVGEGLDDNIRQAYRFLSKHFRPGDEIHIFGFSRGAFSARSIVGYLFATGLLTAQNCTSEREAEAWRYYRTSPNNRHCGDWQKLEPFMHPAASLIVKSLGVFDTVGALGIPTKLLQKINTERFAFHNTELSSIVENSFHAVAIDEHRSAFEATLWKSPKFKRFTGAHVEQVWFPGAHADIGGGYANWDKDQQRTGRQDIAFAWMLQRLIDRVKLDFAALGASPARAVDCDARAMVTALIHRPWGVLDAISHQACRAINETEPLPSDGVPVRGRGTRTVGLRPHEESIGEMIHISALALLEPGIRVAWENVPGQHAYCSPNLMAVLPLIAATYAAHDPAAWSAWKPYTDHLAQQTGTPRTLQVIDWDGTPVPTTVPAKPDAVNVYTHIGDNPGLFGLVLGSTAKAKPGHGS
jgi:hypothetical protein